MFKISKVEKETLIDTLHTAFKIPFIDDVEDFIWEAVFCHTKGIPIVDPFDNTRSKLLFDVVDDINHIGWSAKTIQYPNVKREKIEFVIQRADIFKKANALGYDSLSKESKENILGEALLKHWHKKVFEDAKKQNVSDYRTSILVKSKNKKSFAFIEEELHMYKPTDLKWVWTDSDKVGLQGIDKKSNEIVYRWYPNQKQFFENIYIPKEAYFFDLNPKRLNVSELVKKLT